MLGRAELSALSRARRFGVRTRNRLNKQNITLRVRLRMQVLLSVHGSRANDVLRHLRRAAARWLGPRSASWRHRCVKIISAVLVSSETRVHLATSPTLDQEGLCTVVRGQTAVPGARSLLSIISPSVRMCVCACVRALFIFSANVMLL